ncbi:hypothetical protein H5410_033066 [Solanum commersonii]|uniref:Uncharacterized protein n=1 Tax=Solanum commersonii TaxID=4109 RepID=A0A9J5YPP6_SOLCO|nr:hypothetical protein H5410_033066 [Solanum commersonii]
MNKGETGGPQGKIEKFEEGDGSKSIKEEWQEPEKNDENFANKAKKNKDFIKHYHNDDKSRFMPNRLPIGDIGTQFLDLDCKKDPETGLDLWSQSMLLYSLLGKRNYTDEEKYIIMINTFTEKKHQEILIHRGATANHIKGILLDGISIYEGNQYTYKTFEGNNFSCKNMVDLPIQLDTIRITVSCYITSHESDQDLILGNLFLNKLEDYSIGKNGIEMLYKGETCFIPKI